MLVCSLKRRLIEAIPLSIQTHVLNKNERKIAIRLFLFIKVNVQILKKSAIQTGSVIVVTLHPTKQVALFFGAVDQLTYIYINLAGFIVGCAIFGISSSVELYLL